MSSLARRCKVHGYASESFSRAAAMIAAVAAAVAAVCACVPGAHAAAAAIAAVAAVAAGGHACVSNEDSNLATFLGGSSAAGLSEATSQARLSPAGLGNTVNDSFVSALTRGGLRKEPANLAGATATGGTTNGLGFANAVAGYGLFAGSVVAPATSDEDEAFAKALVAGRVTTTRRDTKDAFAE